MDTDLRQAVIHQLRLLVWDELILIVMDQQEWQIVRCHIRDRACLHDVMFTEADPLHHFNIRIGKIPRQVDHRSESNDRFHAARLIQIFSNIKARVLIACTQ